MAKRTGGLPGFLRSLDPDELECIEKAAADLNLSLHYFVGYARLQGEGYVESILADHLDRHRGGPKRGGQESKNGAVK